MKYKTELHCHTKESSSCSQIDAKQLVDVLKLGKYELIGRK